MRDRVDWRPLLVALAWGCAACAPSPEPREPARPAAEPRRVSSNLLRADYAGSDACEPCHAEIYAAWQTSPMRNMTRRATAAAIRAPFDGATFTLGGDTATMEEIGGERFVRLTTARDGMRLYRITKVIGGRYREDYAGVDVTGAPDPATAPGRGPERVMPVSYVYETRSWRYKGYSVLVRARPELRVGVVWAQTCIGCHNTLPALTMLYDDLHGPGAPGYQGTISDRLLPPERLWQALILDGRRLRRALADEIAFLGGPRPDPEASLRALLADTMRLTRRRFDERHLVEVGIGCEACHGGAREHVDDPDVLPSFAVRGAQVRVGPAAPTPAEQINRVCARCHTVLFSRYPHTWEGGHRRAPVPGGSNINSGEARDFLLGGCATQMRCTACHDPHAADPPERLRALATPAGNTVCTGCHAELVTAEAVQAHSHHPPGSEGSACVACHMPRKNMGLAYELTRYHRIGSPTEPARVLRDRPLECALCHVDRSVEDLVATMERWWGKRYDRKALRALYGGELGVNVLEATLQRGKPHEHAVAIGVLGERGNETAVSLLAPHLDHEYPLVRYFARHAIQAITGAGGGVEGRE